MITVAIELAALVALGAAGWLLVPPAAGAPWRLAAALPVGLAAVCVVELALLLTQLPIGFPWLALALALVLAGVVAWSRRASPGDRAGGTGGPGGPGPRPRQLLGAGALVTVVVVAATAAVPLVTVTADSFRYLTISRILAVDGDTAAMSAFLLESRSLAVGTVHGLAATDLGYLRAVTPLTAVSTLAMLWLLVREGTPRLDAGTSRWVAGGAVLLLATNHRFLFNAFYLNGHLFFAAWLVVLVAISWRRLRPRERGVAAAAGSGAPVEGGRATPSDRRLGDALVAAVVAIATAVVRPEAALVVVLVLAPVVLAPSVPVRWRRVVLGAFGAGVLAWHAGVLIPMRTDSVSPLVGMVGLGLATLVLAAALPVVDRGRDRRALVVLHGLAWVAVVVFSVREPSILVRSIESTGRNVLTDGAWGVSLLVLGGLVAVAIALRRVPGERAVLFPLLTFVPAGLLFAFLRGAGWRVGPGDSLNRMIMHVVPLAVLALAWAADGEPRRAVTADDEP